MSPGDRVHRQAVRDIGDEVVRVETMMLNAMPPAQATDICMIGVHDFGQISAAVSGGPVGGRTLSAARGGRISAGTSTNAPFMGGFLVLGTSPRVWSCSDRPPGAPLDRGVGRGTEIMDPGYSKSL